MIRVVIADDQDLVRAGFRMILDAEPDIEVLDEAADGESAVALVDALAPDVVLMDIRMPGIDGIEATRRLTNRGSHSKVLVLTTFDSDEYVYLALQAGAAGFLLKTASAARLIEGIHLVHAGEALLAPTVTRRLIETYLRRPAPNATRPASFDALTERELEVLRAIGQGRSNAEIAEHFVLSQATVKTHVNRIFAKLGLRDRVQAVVLAYETGLLEPGSQTQ